MHLINYRILSCYIIKGCLGLMKDLSKLKKGGGIPWVPPHSWCLHICYHSLLWDQSHSYHHWCPCSVGLACCCLIYHFSLCSFVYMLYMGLKIQSCLFRPWFLNMSSRCPAFLTICSLRYCPITTGIFQICWVACYHSASLHYPHFVSLSIVVFAAALTLSNYPMHP